MSYTCIDDVCYNGTPLNPFGTPTPNSNTIQITPTPMKSNTFSGPFNDENVHPLNTVESTTPFDSPKDKDPVGGSALVALKTLSNDDIFRLEMNGVLPLVAVLGALLYFSINY